MRESEAERVRVVEEMVRGYLEHTRDGLIANSIALERDPRDRSANARLQGHLLELDRLLSIHGGLVLLTTAG